MKTTLRAVAAAAAFAGAASAQQICITFDEPDRYLEHGSKITSSTYADLGVAFSAATKQDPHWKNRAIVFDTNEDWTRDPDLEAPFAGGNLAGRTDLGNALIIAENLVDWDPKDGLIDNPDDNARGGFIWVDFTDQAATEIGFSIYDTPEANGELALTITLTDSMGTTANVTAQDLLNWNPDAVWGDHFANAYDPIQAGDVGLKDIQSAEFFFDGSGALDTFKYTLVPEPGSLLLVALAGGAALLRRRRG